MHIEVSTMLEVDGHVVSRDELIQRVEQLIGSAPKHPKEVAGTTSSGLAPGDLEEQVHAVRLLQGQIRPPDLIRGQGVRGQLGWIVKRAVRKSSSWYVEPRWNVQQEFDVRSAEFATQVLNQLRALSREVENLRRDQLALRSQLVTNLERANALRARMEAAATEMERNHQEMVDLLVERLGADNAGPAVDGLPLASELGGDPG